MTADRQGDVDLLGLEAEDLATQDLGGWLVIRERPPQQGRLALVAAVDRVGQVQVDDGRLAK